MTTLGRKLLVKNSCRYTLIVSYLILIFLNSKIALQLPVEAPSCDLARVVILFSYFENKRGLIISAMYVFEGTWLFEVWEKDWRKKFLAFVIAHKDEVPWDWGELSANKNIDLDLIQQNPSLPWEWPRISENENVTMEIVKKTLDKPWDFFALSSNAGVTIGDVDAMGPWRWSYPYLSSNPSIRVEDIIVRPGRDWDYTWLSSNENVDYSSVQDYPDI